MKKIDYNESTRSTSKPKTEKCVSTSKCLRGKSLKKQVKDIKKCKNDDCDRVNEVVLDDKMSKEVSLVEESHVLNVELPENNRDIDQVPKRIGVKRKRDHGENDARISKGWTKDQELALERAYLTANPTPHFWKKVSRLVPGKSAQECFDKIHCSHLTPPQHRPRSRTPGLISKNSNLSASKFLDSSSQKVKKPSQRRQKSHIIQRTVRHMLQKQFKFEKDSEADLFSVLESTLNHHNHRVITTTPNCIKLKGLEGSSTSYKKSRSRFRSSYETPIISPPVLKQVKNIALHEKYIDQLNCREANRKAASLKDERKGIKHVSSVQRKDAIKAAKFALVDDAKDAINKFQDKQIKALSSIFDDESGGSDLGQDLL